MPSPELFPFAALALLATPVALVFRAWFVHRSNVIRERARTERMRQALRNTAPVERAAILRALQELESDPTTRVNDEK